MDITTHGAFYEVFHTDKRMINWLLFILGMILGFGFIFAHGQNHNYASMKLLSTSLWPWSIGFLIYSLMKYQSARHRLSQYAELGTCLLGAWAWIYIVISFVVVDRTPVAPLELMLFMPLIMEAWCIAINIHGIIVQNRLAEALHGRTKP